MHIQNAHRHDSPGHAHAFGHARKAAEPAPATAPQDSADVVELGEADDSTKQRGVIRNLVAGHYKGVADVRLRINFHDELTALASQQKGTATADGLAAIGQDVGARLDALASRDDLTDDQREILATLRGDFESAFGEAATVEAAQAAADELLTGLDALIAGPADAIAAETETPLVQEPTATVDPIPTDDAALVETIEPIEAPVEEEPIEAAATTLTEDAAALRQSMADAFAQLARALTDIDPLPPLSEPTGNGRAYAKFLDQYLALTADASGEPTDADNEPVEDADEPAAESIDVTV